MKYKILIADDEANIAEFLMKYLNSLERVEVVGTAFDGQDAYNKVLELKPDIIITDICMPKMSGLELLRRIHKTMLSPKEIIISGYDEFDYVKEAISLGVKDYLLKPFSPDELEEVLNKIIKDLEKEKQLQKNMELLAKEAQDSRDLISRYIVRDILQGRKKDISEFDERQRSAFDFEAKLYCVCIIRVQFHLQDNRWDFNFRNSLDDFMMLVDQTVFGEGAKLYAVALSHDRFAMVISSGLERSDFRYQLRTGLNHMANSLNKYYGLTMWCSVGSLYEEWNRIAESYEEALSIWKTMKTLDKTLYFYDSREEASTEKENITDEIHNLKNRLIMEVQIGNEEEALRQEEILLKNYAMLPSKKSDFIAVSLGEMMYAISNFMERKEYLKNTGEGRISKIRGEVIEKMQYGNLMEIKPLLDEYIKECCRVVSMNLKSTRSDKVIEQLKFIIDNNLDNENLNLDMVADQVDLRPNYVRQIFKQKTGEGFVEYLVRCRMSKAMKLLGSSDMKIQDIAESCGYSSQHYFTTSFKKFCGCTPTEYKRMMDAKGEGKGEHEE